MCWRAASAKRQNRLRITGQLIDAATGSHLWADRFEGAVANIFDLQDQVTESVAGAIAPAIEKAEIERAKRKPTDNLNALPYTVTATYSTVVLGLDFKFGGGGPVIAKY